MAILVCVFLALLMVCSVGIAEAQFRIGEVLQNKAETEAEAGGMYSSNWTQDGLAAKTALQKAMSGAIAFYHQYLYKADLKSVVVSDTVLAVYSLQIEQLNDPSGAYAFARNGGNRLSVIGQARQFDKWFLDTAVKRKDIEAVWCSGTGI